MREREAEGGRRGGGWSLLAQRERERESGGGVIERMNG